MKIGILTFLEQLNYGGVLQAYALCTFLRERGYDAEVIRYWLGEKNSALLAPIQIQAAGRPLKYVHYGLHLIRQLAKREWTVLSRDVRCLRTQHFIKRHVRHSAENYTTPEALSTLDKRYQCVIVGSDQVWNPNYGHCRPFLLEHLSDAVRKVAYAASFGVTALPAAQQESYAAAIRRFHRVSCRELGGVAIINDLLTQDVPWVCDPVMLLSAEYWRKLIRPRGQNRGYLFCYWLGDSEKLAALLQTTPSAIPVYLCGHNFGSWVELKKIRKGIYPCPAAGPREFLRLLADSSGVISDSFHAMLFSIIYGKACRIHLSSSDERKSMDDRLFSLAEKLGVSNVLAPDCLYHQPEDVAPQEIERKLRPWRRESEAFLTEAIGESFKEILA